MEYAEYPCADELCPWIAAHWRFRVEPGAGRLEHRVPLTGGSMVSLAPGGPAMVTGPRTAPLVTEVGGGDEFWGTHFWPWATTAFLAPAEELREVEVPLRELGHAAVAERLGPARLGPAEAVAALDAAWSFHARGRDVPDEVVARGAVAILASGGRRPIREIAAGVGLSPRQFRRRFRAAVGLGPKELSRIQRIRATAIGVVRRADREWVDHALTHGFSDQAHLVRELRAFFGTRPAEIGRHLRRIRHGDLIR